MSIYLPKKAASDQFQAALALRGNPPVAISSANKFLYSEDFTQAAHVKVASSITPNAAMALDGALIFSKLVESAATAIHHCLQDVTTSGLTAYTHSRTFKAAERSLVWLIMQDAAAGNGAQAKFNLATGVISNATTFGLGSALSTVMTNLGGGVYRCSISVVCGSGTIVRGDVQMDSGSGTNYAGDGSSGVFMGAAQLEPQSSPGPHCPTGSTPVNFSYSK